MDDKKYSNDLKQMKRLLMVSQLIAVAVTVALLLSLWANVNAFGRDRTIVTPPHLQKSFWINNAEADPAYIEQMAAWVAYLELDITPDNIDWKSKILLGLAHPGFHGELQTRQHLQTDKIRRDNIVTEFSPKAFNVNAQQLAAVVYGTLRTKVNGHLVDTVDQAYFVQFSLAGGRAELTAFEPAPHDDVNRWIEERKHAPAPTK